VNDRRESYQDKRAREEQRALTVVDPLRMPLPAIAVQQHQLTESKWRALTESVFPSAKTVTGVLMALDYCAARRLDVFKRPVHVVPMWNSKLGREVETVWPGIGELRTTASRTGQWAGSDPCQFGRLVSKAFHEKRSTPGRGNNEPRVTEATCPEMDFPEWAQFTVYKIVAGVRCAFVGPQVFFLETFSGEKGLRVPNARWRQAPRQMLQKCAEAAALRMAFPEELGESYAAEEMEGKTTTSGVPQADYDEVDANDDRGRGERLHRQEPDAEPGSDDAGGGEGDQHEQVETGAAQESAWSERKLVNYMGGMRRFLNNVTDMAELEHTLETEKDRVASLPDAERREAQQLEDDARSRIMAAAAEVKNADTATATAAAAHDAPPASDPAPVAAAAPAGTGEDPYVTAFRARVAKVEMIVDLNTLENETMDEVDQQQPLVANICRRILQNRRDALKPQPK